MWVILNGRHSDDVQGLMITSVPPITAPARRYNQIQIDGRDGDIIEDLGASAYDKQFTMLLHNNYDPDDLLRFLSSSGDAIFSSEPTKVYKYTMVGSVDVAKGSFNSIKVATVTLHCQPYKLYAYEQPISLMINAETDVDVINVGNAAAKPLITLTGNGTPTISLNGTDVLVVTITTGQTITIDVEDLEATYGDGTSANRAVVGDMGAMALAPGMNTIGWDGSLDSIIVSRYSRWI